MAKPYSQDLRERVIATIEAGETQSATAKTFKISRRTVVDYVRRWRETGHLAADKFGGHKRHQLARHETKVRSMVEAWPEQTLAELQARLAKAGITTSVTSLDRFLRFIGLSYKKNTYRDRTKTQRRRRGSRRMATGAKNS